MDVSKISYWPSHLFSVLFNSINPKCDQSKHFVNSNKPITRSIKTNNKNIRNIGQARQQLIDCFSDLTTILDSFHQVYLIESDHKSELCERYQRESIHYAKSIIRKAKKNTENFDLPFEMLQHSDAHNLFRNLQNLKKYQLELPNGWYETVKSRLDHIIDANHTYYEIKERISH